MEIIRYLCAINFYIQLLLISLLALVVVYFFRKRRGARDECFTSTDYHKILNDSIHARGRDSLKVDKGGCKKKHEGRCREILEDIFYPHSFPSIRPSFLKNPATGRNLEIDCYNDMIKVGLEYQGVQHRKYTPWYHRSMEDFNKQVERDVFKKNRLLTLNIFMIYVPDTIKYNELEKYIREKLKEM